MNDTIDIAAFATQVRAALADLPPEQVDDLTDGLEADLAERLEDAPDAGLGDPGEYAAELRAAAGYPTATGTGRRPQPLRELQRELRDLPEAWRAFTARHRWAKATSDLLVALKPTWWVFRGWVLYLLIGSTLIGQAPVPGNPFGWFLLIGAVIVSVQFGRGAWLGNTTSASIQRVLNVTLAVLALPIATSVAGWYAGQVAYPEDTWVPSRLMIDGRTIDNIFVYDELGQPIEQAQLFDQDGKPLDLVQDGSLYLYTRSGTIVVPSEDTPGESGWNVYPLRSATQSDLEDGEIDGRPRAATPPFDEVRPLSDVTQEEGPATLEE